MLDEHLVSLRDPTSFEAEQYRALRYIVERVHATQKVIAVSSPTTGDGKTTTALNLAGALAQAPETRILIADLDLRAPSLGNRLGLTPNRPGLVDLILNPNLTLDEVIRPLPELHLSVLPAGRALTVPYEVLKSERLTELLHEARQQYDYVVLDTPPLVPVPDSALITDRADGFLMVVSAHRTPRKLLEDALNRVDPAKLIGIVFNGDDRLLSGNYGYYGYGRTRGRSRGWRGR